MGRGGTGGVPIDLPSVGGVFAAARDRAAELGGKAAELGSKNFDPSRRDASVIAFFVFIIYLCGYFCWFAAMIHFFESGDVVPKVVWDKYLPKGAYKSVAAGSFIAAFAALPLCPLVALRDDVCPCLAASLKVPRFGDMPVRRIVVTVLCVLHVVGVTVFGCGMAKFINNDDRGMPDNDGKSSTEDQLGKTTRQLLIPVFASACLVYLCAILLKGRDVPTMPATLMLSCMTFWLYLCGFFIDFAHREGSEGAGSAGGIAAGSFFGWFTAPVAGLFIFAQQFIPLSEARKGMVVLACTVLHAVGYFIFFCSACAWLHNQFTDLRLCQTVAIHGHKHSFCHKPYAYQPSKNLADVTLFIFMPAFFSVYFMSRSWRQGKALRDGYQCVEGAVGADGLGGGEDGL